MTRPGIEASLLVSEARNHQFTVAVSCSEKLSPKYNSSVWLTPVVSLIFSVKGTIKVLFFINISLFP